MKRVIITHLMLLITFSFSAFGQDFMINISGRNYYNETQNRFEMEDKITGMIDMVSINKYMGWYMAFPADPATIGWSINTDKPLFFF